jgi:acetylglutamate kinase
MSTDVESDFSRGQGAGLKAGATVIKFGGELLEQPAQLATLASAIVAHAAARPTIVVHGGGREIDAELARRGVAKHAVDGLRITDAETLDAVVAILAGTINTRLVAAINAAGGRAVGLTGADDRLVVVEPAPAYRTRDGRLVDLGLVGQPVGGRPEALTALLGVGCVPVLACLGITADGRVLNVNADTLAAHVAVMVGASRLVIAGATAGVLDGDGQPIPSLDPDGIDTLVADGTASAGMVAKLTACREALSRGVSEIAIVDGRQPQNLERRGGTRIQEKCAASLQAGP